MIARDSLLEVRDVIQGVLLAAPFGNVNYALQVFEVLEDSAGRGAAVLGETNVADLN